MILGMSKRPPRVQTAFHKLTHHLGAYLSPQEHQRLASIASDRNPLSSIEDNRWLLEMEQTCHERLQKGRGYV